MSVEGPRDDWPPHLTVDTARILEVLTGDRFYSTKDAALREAVLNAVDACTRRAGAGDEIEPQIGVQFNDASYEVIVTDNGDGMGPGQVTSLFTKIGASMAQVAAEVETVGEFGIGVVSYFLVCDAFEIHSVRPGERAIGMIFDRSMLDGLTPATEVPCARDDQGTTLILRVRDQQLFQLLLDRHPHWFRAVSGLAGSRTQDGTDVLQGRVVEPAQEIALELPDWAESASIGPPVGFDRWSVMDGNAEIDILYRGVYVETQRVDGLWGMQGSISVHPKRLKPRLNREGFLDEDLQREVIPFLQSIHPATLRAGLARLVQVLDDRTAGEWSVNRIVSFWLALPRTSGYEEVVREWDDIFRSRTLFHLLTAEEERDVSLNDLATLDGPLYLVADNLASTPDINRSAVRVLRAQGASVVQGIARDSGFLGSAPVVGQSTADLLLNYFSDQLPEIVRVDGIAEQVVANSVRVAHLFDTEPRVALMRLGDGAPLTVASRELWINVDSDPGRQIVQAVCSENRGRRSLLLACHVHAAGQVDLLPQFVRLDDEVDDRLGLVTRQYLRRLVT